MLLCGHPAALAEAAAAVCMGTNCVGVRTFFKAYAAAAAVQQAELWSTRCLGAFVSLLPLFLPKLLYLAFALQKSPF